MSVGNDFYNIPIYYKLYFPVDSLKENDQRFKYIKMFEQYFKNFDFNEQIKKELKNDGSLTLDYETLKKNLNCQAFFQLLYEQPHLIIPSMEVAAHKIVYKFNSDKVEKLSIRIINFEKTITLRKLKSSRIGKFISLKGTVVRVSNIKPTVIEMVFKCVKCNSMQRVFFKDGNYSLPSSCVGNRCRSRKFLPDLQSAVTIDWQKVRLQQQLSDSSNDAGRIPKTIECELSRDIVDKCVPGDEVIISGIVKVINTTQLSGRGRSNNQQALYFIYIDSNSIVNTKSEKSNVGQEFTLKDLKLIKEIATEKNIFRLIVNSLCPSIFGNEFVKAGLILSIFGGVPKFVNEKNKLPIRGDPHLLIVGDPGLGKSQMLNAVSNISPRGVYVCGNTTSTSGLTVTVVRDKNGDFTLEAGALVLSDFGICCIDEFDKMRHEHKALLEAMEQQTISIAKAGMVCHLPARCCVIAAANPVGGHYSKTKTVSENLKINSALLSRFDLIFILLDKPDELRDQLLSEHVMKLHTKILKTNSKKRTKLTQLTQISKKPLKERLKVKSGNEIDPIPSQLLKIYLSYAKKYCKPVLSNEACDVLQEFYLSLRKLHQNKDSTPITTRQLESLMRLSQARAKLELREIVTQQDALDVIEIMKESLYDVLTDEYGQIDFRRTSGSSKSKSANIYISELNKVSISKSKALFSYNELYSIYKNSNIKVNNFDNLIEQLNGQGYLLKKGGRLYQLQISELAMVQ